eukprot:4172035-Heterocapsa_arctica.AAC.1
MLLHPRRSGKQSDQAQPARVPEGARGLPSGRVPRQAISSCPSGSWHRLGRRGTAPHRLMDQAGAAHRSPDRHWNVAGL